MSTCRLISARVTSAVLGSLLTAGAVGVVFHVFCSFENKVFLCETRDASGRLQRSGAVKGERSEFISTLDSEHR